MDEKAIEKREESAGATLPTPSPASHDNGSQSLFPSSWTKRWPVLVAIGAIILVLSNLAQIVSGLDAFANTISRIIGGRETPRMPLELTISKEMTRKLDGYEFLAKVSLPKGREPGPVYPGGVKTQLTLQATGINRVVQVERLRMEVRYEEIADQVAFNYAVDPTKQSGFGTSRLSEYTATLDGHETGSIYYVTDKGEPRLFQFPDLLPRDTRVRLDAGVNSLQEAFLLNIVPIKPGFYTVNFRAVYLSEGKEAELVAGPLYIVLK